MTKPAIEDLLRELTPQVLGALVRRHCGEGTLSLRKRSGEPQCYENYQN